jgi:hypothetical protein
MRHRVEEKLHFYYMSAIVPACPQTSRLGGGYKIGLNVLANKFLLLPKYPHHRKFHDLLTERRSRFSNELVGRIGYRQRY